MASSSQPVLFVSHGAPTLALDGGAWGEALAAWAGERQGIRSILVVSAHWEQAGPLQVMSSPNPETMHDFGGFPEPLYRLRYPAPGNAELAERVTGLLQGAGMEAALAPGRPLDHGAWVPLRAAFPEARVPVLQVSLPRPRTPRQIFDLGRALRPLREEGVLLMGSGGIVHNLRLLDWSQDGPAEAWAVAFEQWVTDRLRQGDAPGLFAAAQEAPSYPKAVPTSEHFDPLYFALGAAGDSPLRSVFDGWQLGNLSLRTWSWGA